jgi:hypothetical protein
MYETCDSIVCCVGPYHNIKAECICLRQVRTLGYKISNGLLTKEFMNLSSFIFFQVKKGVLFEPFVLSFLVIQNSP